jgi:hypothetical protein
LAAIAIVSPHQMRVKGAKSTNVPQNDGFRSKSRCRLRYHAQPIPRIVRASGMAGVRGPAVRYFFDPAETT